jgi:hypothetical protein
MTQLRQGGHEVHRRAHHFFGDQALQFARLNGGQIGGLGMIETGWLASHLANNMRRRHQLSRPEYGTGSWSSIRLSRATSAHGLLRTARALLQLPNNPLTFPDRFGLTWASLPVIDRPTPRSAELLRLSGRWPTRVPTTQQREMTAPGALHGQQRILDTGFRRATALTEPPPVSPGPPRRLWCGYGPRGGVRSRRTGVTSQRSSARATGCPHPPATVRAHHRSA